MQRLLSVSPLRTSSFSQTCICKSCNAYLTGTRLYHSSELRQRPDENDGNRPSNTAPARPSNQSGEPTANTSSSYPRSGRAQRAADTAAIASGLLSSARSQQEQERQHSGSKEPSSTSSPSYSASSSPAPSGALDLRSQAAKPSGDSLIRRAMVAPRTRPEPGPGQEQTVIRRRREGYGGNDRGRGRMGAGTGSETGTGARGRESRYNDRYGDRSGPQRYRPNRSNNAEDKDREGDEASDKLRKFDKLAPKSYLLSDMEIQHLIAQRDKFHGRPQPVKPTVGIAHDTSYFRGVPESGALIRGKEEQRKKEENDDDDVESSSINAAEAEVAARLRVVASTAGTRYTTRLGTRLLQGRYVELYDQEGHIDRVLEAARDEQAEKNKKKQSKKAAADDEAHLEALAASADTSTAADTGTGTGKTTIDATLRTIQDPRGRWRPVDFEPLGSAEIDFLTRELVKGEYDEVGVSAGGGGGGGCGRGSGVHGKSYTSPLENSTSNNKNNNDVVFDEATRQMIQNSTYLPKDVRMFRQALEKVLRAGGAGGAGGASASVVADAARS